jgi:hypothetical protein
MYSFREKNASGKFFEKIKGYKLYRTKTFRKMMLNLGIQQKIYICNFYYDFAHRKLRRGWRRNTPKLSSLSWFNWILYMLIFKCLTAFKDMGLEKMFDTQELAGFFNVQKYIDNYMTIPMLLEEYEDTLTEKEFEKIELFQGIPYNKRIFFLGIRSESAKSIFSQIKNISKMYEI